MKTITRMSPFLLLIILLSAVSCSKDAGEGGTSGIRGKVHAKYYDDYFLTYLGAGYAQDQEVFIIYGDDPSYSDKVTTSYDGAYEFEYLRKGTYTVFVYTKDSTLVEPSGKYAVVQNVEIDANNTVVELPDFEIFD